MNLVLNLVLQRPLACINTNTVGQGRIMMFVGRVKNQNLPCAAIVVAQWCFVCCMICWFIAISKWAQIIFVECIIFFY